MEDHHAERPAYHTTDAGQNAPSPALVLIFDRAAINALTQILWMVQVAALPLAATFS
jgi:hypothetical protein